MVNQLPQGWKEEELGNLVDIFDNLRKPVSSTERLVRIKNKDKSELYPYYGATGLVDYIDGYIFDGEYLLLGEDGCPFLEPLKDKAYIISGKTWVNNHAHVLRAKESKTSNKFLLYYLNKFDYNGIVSGATRLKLNQNSMKKIPVYYPTDKGEQEYIVKTLDAVAEMIKLRKETIQLTKDLIPAIFQEMFGDPITNPKGWEILSLDNIITQINNGYNPPKKDFGTGIPFVTVNNLYNGLSIDYDSLDKVMVSNKQIQKYKLNYGDICFVRSSVKREGIGQASAYLSNQDAIFGGFVIRVTPKEIFNPIFLSEYFQTEAMRNIIINKSVTGVMTNINQPALLSIPVLNVPFSMQKEFADNVKQINQNLEVQQKDLERLQELFDQLLQKAFTGELTRGEAYGK